MILNAKCHAIRDAQILEKRHIGKEMDHEEKRLDQMMEKDRLNAISMQEEIESKRRDERYLASMTLMDQIQENEQVSCCIASATCPLFWIDLYTASKLL